MDLNNINKLTNIVKKNIYWFASAWDLESQKFLNKFNLKYNKIASAMIVDKKFLNYVASQKNIHLFQQA